MDEWLKTFSSPFIQQPPDDACPDPSCVNHDQLGSMRILATYSEENEELWNRYGDFLQIIWQYCPRCEALLATNQAT
ncbi:MAG TPA: hypothetical protein VMP01_08325 [Pirellulaceae bacterium]|nr:hypothetical protein [Pirellulaceae bacterium]